MNKKYISSAVLGIILAIGITTLSWSASAPGFSDIPDLKLFIDQALPNAFNIEDFNTGDVATSYNVPINFLSNSSFSGSSVNQAAFGSATSGDNTFVMDNAFGSGTVSNKAKYSTYKINKLPKVGLTVGSSWDVNVADYTHDSVGLAVPASFGIAEAIENSDTTKVSATWSGSNIVHLTALQAFSGAVDIDIIAAPSATAPFGADIDKERIKVYANLLPNSTFSTANDTSIYSPLEIPPGRTTFATQSWQSSANDGAGTPANGVWKFTFPDATAGVKGTPSPSTWVNITNGQWYIIRMRVAANAANTHQSVLFGYTNLVGGGIQTDIGANVFFGVPTTWTWQETPILAHGNSTSGYPQFQFKASGAGSVLIDEIQMINAAPTLVDASRGNTRLHYASGNFDAAADTTGWGKELYTGAGTAPAFSVNTGTLQLDFAGATTGSGQKGLKWTSNENNTVPQAATYPVTIGNEVGVRMTVTKISGNFDNLGIVLVAAYGVQTSGQQSIAVPPSNIIAAAGVGIIPGGVYRTVAQAVNGFYQFQFGLRSNQAGVLAVDDVDFDQDYNDSNLGDAVLFP